MKEWFRRLSQREQGYLLLAGVAVLVYLLHQVLWSPLSALRDDLGAGNQRAAASLERVREMSAQLQQLQSGGAPRNRNLSQLINSSTARHGITPTRIQSGAGGSMQIRFEAVNFAALLRWLNQVERLEGLVFRNASISQGSRDGLVDASIRVSLGL